MLRIPPSKTKRKYGKTKSKTYKPRKTKKISKKPKALMEMKKITNKWNKAWTFVGIDFENSLKMDRKLNYARSSELKFQFRALAECIYQRIWHNPCNKRLRNREIKRKMRALEILLSNLFYARAQDKTLSISLDRNNYKRLKNNSFRNFVEFAFRGMSNLDLIKKHKGFYSGRKYDERNRVTRIYASIELTKLMNDYGISLRKFNWDTVNAIKDSKRRYNGIVVHDGRGNDITENRISADYQRRLAILNSYNEMIQHSVISLPRYMVDGENQTITTLVPKKLWETADTNNNYHLQNHLEVMDICTEPGTSGTLGTFHTIRIQSDKTTEPNPYKETNTNKHLREITAGHTNHITYYYTQNIKPNEKYLLCRKLKTTLHRIYIEDFKNGGRFYGGRYQTIPRELRPFILINDQPVIEIDYGSLHPRMLYNRKNLPCPRDPYGMVCEYLRTKNPKIREMVKTQFLMLINAESESDAKGAQYKKLRDKSELWGALKSEGLTINNLLEAIKEVHKPINDYFNTGIGLTLMNEDSDIAEKILLYFTQKGIPCLCMHDSFIVPAQFADELESIMKSTYYDKFNFDCVIKRSGDPEWLIRLLNKRDKKCA